jgi:hypothetical protein
LEISSEKGVGTKVTISLRLMLKKFEKEVAQINNKIIKEEEDKVAQAIMNKQMLVLYKSSVDSDGDIQRKVSEILSEGNNTAILSAPKKDGWGWEDGAYGQRSPTKNRGRSSCLFTPGEVFGESKEFENYSRMGS